MPVPLFPESHVVRPAVPEDARTVTSLFRISESHDLGEAYTTLEDMLSGWNMPDFALADETLTVFDSGEMIAYADVYQWKAEVTVHPRARGRGIGASLLSWTEQTTLSRRLPGEEARIGQTLNDRNIGAIELLKTNGYTPRHTSWALRLPREAVVEPRPLPQGYQVRRYRPATETRQVYQIVEDAFNEWPNRTPSSFERWKAWTVDRADFDPDLLFVAVTEGSVIGVALCLPYPEEGWVHQLAVHRDHRNLGLAKALLAMSFGEMRARGLPDVGLSTDSRTGALNLYLDVGMEVRESFTHYSKLLRPAEG